MLLLEFVDEGATKSDVVAHGS